MRKDNSLKRSCMFTAWQKLPSSKRVKQFTQMIVDPSMRHQLDLSKLVAGGSTYLGVCLADSILDPVVKVELLRTVYRHFPSEAMAWLEDYRQRANVTTQASLDLHSDLTSGMLCARLATEPSSYTQLVSIGWWPGENSSETNERAPRTKVGFAEFCAMMFTAAFKRLSEDAALLRLESVVLYHSNVDGLTLSVLEDVIGSREASIFADEWREEHVGAAMHVTELSTLKGNLPCGLISDLTVLLRACSDPGVGAMLNTRSAWVAAMMLPWNAHLLNQFQKAMTLDSVGQNLQRFGEDLYYVWTYVAYQRSRTCTMDEARFDVTHMLSNFPSDSGGYNNLSIDYMAVETITYHVRRAPELLHCVHMLVATACALQQTVLKGTANDTKRCKVRHAATVELWLNALVAFARSPVLHTRPDVVADLIELCCIGNWRAVGGLKALIRVVPSKTLWYSVDKLAASPPDYVLKLLPPRPTPTPNAPEDYITSSTIVHPAALCTSLDALLDKCEVCGDPAIKTAVRECCIAGTIGPPGLPKDAVRFINAWLLQSVHIVELEGILRALRNNPLNPYTREPLDETELLEMQSWPFAQQKINEAYSK